MAARAALPVLPDSLACMCCSAGAAAREPVLAALSEQRGGACDRTAQVLLRGAGRQPDQLALFWSAGPPGAKSSCQPVKPSYRPSCYSGSEVCACTCLARQLSTFCTVGYLNLCSSRCSLTSSCAWLYQVPEEAWAAQSREAAAQALVCALSGAQLEARRTALLLVADRLSCEPALASALAQAMSRSVSMSLAVAAI